MCRRHEEGFCIAFSQTEDRQNFSVSFLPGACFVLVLHCRKLRQRQRKTNSETLGKGSTKTAGKAERDSFYSRKNLFQYSGKMSWAVIWKITLIFVSQPENKVLYHSLFLWLGYPVALRGMRCGRVLAQGLALLTSCTGKGAPLPACFPSIRQLL